MSRVAVVQAASLPGDPEGSAHKAAAWIAEAAAGGATVVVLPEAFIGGYPKGSSFGAPVGVRTAAGREEFQRYAEAAVALDGPELGIVADAAREHDICVVIGVIERDGGTLYCTAVMLTPEDGIAGIHRKLMPTGAERIIWGFGDGSTLDTVDTPAGRVGTVICWENYMPLLRQAMYAKGVELYCAPTADDRDTWASTMTHVALEGRCHVLSACQFITTSAYPDHHSFDAELPFGDTVLRGGSMIVDPMGTVLAGPVYDKETILFAEIDPAAKSRAHLDFDAVGHYARPDVFELRVRTTPQRSVTFDNTP